MVRRCETFKKAVRRLVLVVLVASAVGLASDASLAYASGSAELAASVPQKKPKNTSLAAAAGWVVVDTQAKLQVAAPPEQSTDPSAPRVQQISSLIAGLSFKGLAVATDSRAQPDPNDPSLLVGNYTVKVVVFGSAADARKFRAADAKDVTAKGSLKKVGTYKDGVVLDDGQGHINVMFTIGNVAVDIRTGVTETSPGTGVKDIKKVAAFVVANSKRK